MLPQTVPIDVALEAHPSLEPYIMDRLLHWWATSTLQIGKVKRIAYPGAQVTENANYDITETLTTLAALIEIHRHAITLQDESLAVTALDIMRKHLVKKHITPIEFLDGVRIAYSTNGDGNSHVAVVGYFLQLWSKILLSFGLASMHRYFGN